MPTPEYHALLSPSSAARWLHCTPSVRLGEHIPETTSESAEKGRLAHAIAELKARKKFFILSQRTYHSQLKKLQSEPLYEKVMDSSTDTYVEVLTEHAMSFRDCPATALEQSVPIGLYTGEKKEDGSPATGTADCIQIAEGVLWITDYKNGSGIPVSAEDNPQMKLYALGALRFYYPFYGDTIHTIKTTIVQPNLYSVSDWEIPRRSLEAWGRDILAPAAALAWAGEGEQNPGEWCKTHFCPIRATCRARANNGLALESFKRSLPPVLTDAEVGGMLRQVREMKAWAVEVEDYALTALLQGKEIPGWKAVESRGGREWDNLDAAFKALVANGVAEAVLWERKPLTPPALEKELGKKTFAEVAESHVVKKPGKPALAQESDKRPPYNAAAIAFGEAVTNA